MHTASRYRFLVAVIILALFSRCKKDVLHWQQVQQLDSHTAAAINHIRFVTNNICIAAGGKQFEQSVILRSADGGYTWTITSNSEAQKAMVGMCVPSNSNIYLTGVDGDVLHSKDSGITWQFNRINDWAPYVGGCFLTPDTGIFISHILQRECTITRVDSSFNIIDAQTFLFGLNDFYPVNSATAYAVGYGAVIISNDRGTTWNFQDVQGDNFTAMDIHGSEIWLCGAKGGVYHTLDNGSHWQQLRNGNDISLPSYMLRSIAFKDSQHGWAAGDDGLVIYTNDGGHHWAEYDKFTSSTLYSIVLCPDGRLLTGGNNGKLFRILPK